LDHKSIEGEAKENNLEAIFSFDEAHFESA
jgi:hypothetical protein